MVKSAKFNINDIVQFRLTPYGKTLLENYIQDEKNTFGVDSHNLFKIRGDGSMKLSMWEFMIIFGRHFASGNQIIELNELTFIVFG